MTASTSSLVFDDTLELCDPDGHVSSESYHFEAIADGASWGDPQPVEVALNSLMRDGAITVTTGDENREVTFVVKVKGTDSDSLDAGVQALQAATRKRTTLVWTPPDGFCEPRAWDVETSNLLEPNGFDDLAYMLRNEQVFRLRLVCLPYRRSTATVVDDAGTPPSSGGTLLDDCESTTGWATSYPSPHFTPDYDVDSVIFSEGAGSIRSACQDIDYVTATGISTYYNRDKRSGLSESTGSGGYLCFSARGELANATLDRAWMTTDLGGREEITSVLIAAAQDAEGFVRYVWPVDAGLTLTELEFWASQSRISDDGIQVHFWYDDIELLPSATTDHQIVKQHFVRGSARTAGSMQISSPSESVALGKVQIITMPTSATPPGYQPDGARWVTQGTTTVDASALYGTYYTPNTSTYDDAAGYPIFDVPVAMLTAGPYVMVSLVKVESTPLVAGVQAQLLVGGTEVGPASAAEVSIPNIDTGWSFVPLGTVYLPPLPTQNADDTTCVRLLFKGAKLADVYMIPAWEVNGHPVADFTIVDCGSGTVEPGGASSSLWIDSPSTTQPEGGIWRGPTADRANTQSAWPDLLVPGVHVFKPGSLTNFVVSLGAGGPTSTLTYFPRYL